MTRTMERGQRMRRESGETMKSTRGVAAVDASRSRADMEAGTWTVAWRRGRRLAMVLLIAAPIVTAGCGKKDEHPFSGPPAPTEPNPAAKAAAVAGWQSFQQRDYTAALASFNQAIAIQSTYLYALEGRGWCQLRMNDLPTAEASFDSALAHVDNWQDDASEADALVGKALVASALDEYDTAAAAGSQAAEVAGESYVFRGDPAITVSQPRIVAAEAYIRLKQYTLAYNMLVALDVTVLQRINPNSEEFVTLMVEEIQRISIGLQSS